MDLSLRQLEAFAAVARAGSFTAAAGELHVSQSALSRTVAELERTVRVRLLVRDTRNVALTPQGAELLAVAERVLSAHRAEMNQLSRFLAGERGTVTIATLPSVAAVLLPPVISTLHAERPEISVCILDGLARSVIDHVTSGEADLAITVAGQLPDGLVARPFVQDRFFAAVPPGHPLADRSELRWNHLAGEQFVSIGADSSVRSFTDAAFRQADVRVAGVVEASNVATVGGLVAAGLGVTVLPALVQALMSFAVLTHRPIVAPVVERRLDIVTRADRAVSPAVQHVLGLLGELRFTGHQLPPGVSWTDVPDQAADDSTGASGPME
ncbi:LysR family transcriptional regulator [Streptomyces tubercidicus]|uniref:LysR family transcriptional regulator n=1 Tax=Streptomyces tubercidicus TaxID=47759 RepID=UPI0034660DCA